ncbi:MAG: thioesterase family protein [Rhodococcus sp. (in: high G+C Gram-positive bacteria)]
MTKSVTSLAAVADYPCLVATDTRWADNDQYGHLNNAVYYQLFDSAINRWIAEQTVSTAPPPTFVVAESGCTYYRELSFPSSLLIGFGITRLGRTSVTYDIVIRDNEHDSGTRMIERHPAARGRWVHVHVDPHTRRPAEIPNSLRDALQKALIQKG